MTRKSALEDVYPLTPMQEGMLFHTLYHPGSGVYVGQQLFRICGALEVDAFRRAWETVMERHAALRTAFAWERVARPLQVVRRGVPLPLEIHDWRGMDRDEQEAALARHLDEDRARGFDPAAAPLLRLALFRTAEDEHRLAWSVHHLVVDGWSVSLVFRDVMAAYQAYARGAEPRLSAAPRFRDYVAWLRGRGGSEAFWRRALEGFDEPTPLGVDRPAGATPGATGEARAALDPVSTARLGELARANGLTANTLVQGAWALLLARYSGRDDVVFGATVSGRPAELAGGDEMVGLFINTLPVRVRIDADAPLLPWLKRLQAAQAELREHEHAPLAEVQRWSGIPAGRPLFESFLVFQNFPLDEALGRGDEGLRVEAEEAREQAGYPLVVSAAPGDALTLELMYDRSRFDAATAERMLERLRALLRRMADAPERRLGDFGLADAEERAVLVARNPARGPEPACVHQAFAARAARTPGAPALLFGERTVTYAELDAAANRLAHALIARGVRPGARVCVCMERAPEMVIAFLAVLKAGGAFVPLDPEYPAERLARMVDESASPVVLAHEAFRDRLPAGVPVLAVDSEAAAIDGQPSTDPAVSVSPEDLFYVTYTSGSTGTPKGSEVPHRAVFGFFRDARFPGGPGEVFLQHCSPQWDACVLETWPALVTGAACALFPGRSAEPEEIERAVRAHGVTTIFLPAGLFNLLMDTRPDALAGVRHLTVGGDVVSAPRARAALERFPGLRVMNGYGPSECTVFSACHLLPAGWSGDAVPIGTPVGDRRLYVLDAHGNLAADGVPGELFVGGPAVARGYLGRPALTAERFVPDPFGEPGARLYRTGDRVRWGAEGALEFMGRLDRQVKVRGFRVEPGEIEAALLAHPAVREAAVVAREDAPGEKRLVAYVVPPEGTAAPSAAELRDHLAALPAYMHPSAFVALDRFPLTPNGKLDRRALPAPAMDAAASDVAPRTPAEEMVAGVWAEVLGGEIPGVHDSFFGLGGHSLTAMQAVSRLRHLFAVDLPLRALFDAPTVAELAARIEAERRGGEGAALPPPVPVARSEGADLPLSLAQQRLWFLQRMDPASSAYHVWSAFRVSGALDAAALARAFAAVVARHEALRTVFPAVDGAPVQRVRPAPAAFPLDVHDLSPLDEVARAVLLSRCLDAEVERPFDLSAGPLLRARLLRTGVEEHVLLVVTHHLVSDRWSLEVLLSELSALYAAEVGGGEAGLAPLGVQYADYARWQREHLAGSALSAQLAWWRERLAGLPALLELPTDRPRPAARSGRGAARSFSLPPEAAAAARALARREGATLFMVLLAAWQALLARYAGTEDVAVGAPVSGRSHRALEPLIGFFLNTLVLRTSLAGAPSFKALLGRVREGVLEAHARQDVPFERLVEELKPPRTLSHTPLVQVAFTLNAAGAAPLRLGGLELSPVERDADEAAWDLDLAVDDLGERIEGSLTYAAELFDGETIDRMLGHLAALIAAAAAEPDRPVAELPILSADEERALLVERNAMAAEIPAGTLVEMWERQASATPGAIALVGGGERLTYAEADARADRIARRLRALGVGPERLVGVCLDRSPALVTAVLGVLKAGGAYVPLDPAHPPARLEAILSDARAPVLLTRASLRPALASLGGGVTVIDLDAADSSGADLDGGASMDDDQPRRATAENLAYVIFTSGSTGRPKGVMVRNGAVANFLASMRREPGMAADDVLLAVTTPAFDISVLEMFLPLVSGARVAIASREAAVDGARLAAEMERERATVLQATPATWRMLLDSGWSGRPGLRALCGGEALPADLAREISTRSVALWNLYGPTETTVWSTTHRVASTSAAPPVGTPIANTSVYVLDRFLRPVPAGVPGELWIGGAGLARGYLGRPSLTAEKFVPDPFSAAPGARMYRTGDRARWRADGALEYAGRLDAQVKVRGFRIEPGEVEAALREMEGVREAVVGARGERLVAWIVADAAPSPAAMRDALRARLPEYMLPAAFVFLDALPLGPSGKVDRRALPDPETAVDRTHLPPRTPWEASIARLWGEVLERDGVGVDDDFFELGGHSLLAIRLLARVRAELGAEVALPDFFAAPTVEATAAHAARALAAAADPGALHDVLAELDALSDDEARALLTGAA